MRYHTGAGYTHQVHSTAGVYVICGCSPLFLLSAGRLIDVFVSLVATQAGMFQRRHGRQKESTSAIMVRYWHDMTFVGSKSSGQAGTVIMRFAGEKGQG